MKFTLKCTHHRQPWAKDIFVGDQNKQSIFKTGTGCVCVCMCVCVN